MTLTAKIELTEKERETPLKNELGLGRGVKIVKPLKAKGREKKKEILEKQQVIIEMTREVEVGQMTVNFNPKMVRHRSETNLSEMGPEGGEIKMGEI